MNAYSSHSNCGVAECFLNNFIELVGGMKYKVF